MKRLIIVTRKEKLDDIKKIIQEKYSCGMTVTQVEGVGNQADFQDSEGVRLGKNNQLDIILMPKVRIEAVVMDNQTEPLIEDICQAARTGRYGDGKIFVENVIDAIRIRTGERGEDALNTTYTQK
ncbi:MAG: P-II family nitrogen regulator [Clostridium sp.]|nr:P-II family nitrogen regulator [Clostridium sp.]